MAESTLAAESGGPVQSWVPSFRSIQRRTVRTSTTTTFSETDFLSSAIGESIFAVTMDPLSLEPGQVGRLFVVSKEGF